MWHIIIHSLEVPSMVWVDGCHSRFNSTQFIPPARSGGGVQKRCLPLDHFVYLALVVVYIPHAHGFLVPFLFFSGIHEPTHSSLLFPFLCSPLMFYVSNTHSLFAYSCVTRAFESTRPRANNNTSRPVPSIGRWPCLVEGVP